MTETGTMQTPPATSSAGRKWAIGCGIGCLVLLLIGVILAGVGVWGYHKLRAKVDAWSAEFEAQGYEKMLGQNLDINDTVTKRMVYVGQMVRLFGDSQADVAMIAQMGEVHGRIEGDLRFHGQMLILQPNAVITGNVNADAQVVQVNRAVVMGEISGAHQLQDRGMRRQVE